MWAIITAAADLRLLRQLLTVTALGLACSVGNIAIAEEAGERTPEVSKDASGVVMKLYFFRLRAVTEVLIRKQDIERYRPIWFLGNHPFVTKLRTLLESKTTDKKIAPSSIRLKVEFVRDGNIFYMDRFGTVEKSSGVNFELSPQEVDELQANLENFTGVVDMKARASLP